MGQSPGTLNSWKFDVNDNSWKAVEPQGSSKIKQNTISIVTLNQWFSPFKMQERIMQQLHELQQLSPDFICLQESKRRYRYNI